MNSKLTVKDRVYLLVLFLAVAFFIGDQIWFRVDPESYKGIWDWATMYRQKGPAWVSDERLIDDAWQHYRFDWDLDTSVVIGGEVVIYDGNSVLSREYYFCEVQLRREGGVWILRVQPEPFEASEECFDWARGLKIEFYRGAIKVIGDQKVIEVQRDFGFEPDKIVLVPPDPVSN